MTMAALRLNCHPERAKRVEGSKNNYYDKKKSDLRSAAGRNRSKKR